MERLTKFLSWICGLFLVLCLIFIFKDIVSTSLNNFTLTFLLESPQSAGREGGILSIIFSTFLILGVCLVVVIPIGLMSALYISEHEGDSKKRVEFIRKSVKILSGVPSIVFGLFGNALFSQYLGMGFSILSGGLTLALMSLPLFITTVESGLRSLPNNYRLVSASLGLSRSTTIFSLVIPFAIPSIAVGIVLSVGRSLAETAALIFTSGYVDRMPESLFDSGRALSVHIFDLSMNVPGGDTNAYQSSMILIFLIFMTNGIFNLLLKNWYRKRIAL